MSEFCNPTCITSLPDFGAVSYCDIAKSFTSGEIGKVILAACNTTFTDLLDDAEWTALLTAGDVSIPFLGNGSIAEGAETGSVRVGAYDVSVGIKKPFEFMTKIADTTAHTEWSLFNDLHENKANLGIMFLTIDGILLVSPSWTTGNNPLLKIAKMNINQIFNGEAEGQMEYKISGELREELSFKRVKLNSAVLAVLNA